MQQPFPAEVLAAGDPLAQLLIERARTLWDNDELALVAGELIRTARGDTKALRRAADRLGGPRHHPDRMPLDIEAAIRLTAAAQRADEEDSVHRAASQGAKRR